jgi:hypothetical protein
MRARRVPSDAMQMTGVLELRLVREDGGIEVTTVENLVTNAGKAVVADRQQMVPTKAAMTYMALGTGGTAPAVTDTQLVAEVAGSRIGFDTMSVTGPVITYVTTFGAGVGQGAIVEAGLFNDPAAGDMMSRSTYGVITKGPKDVLQITWTITIG